MFNLFKRPIRVTVATTRRKQVDTSLNNQVHTALASSGKAPYLSTPREANGYGDKSRKRTKAHLRAPVANPSSSEAY